jgi:hypothetical protein
MRDRKEQYRKYYSDHKEQERARAKKYYQGHKDERKQYWKNEYISDPEKYKNRAKKYHERHPERTNARRLAWNYGIDQAWIDKKIKEQNGRCAICLQPFIETPHVDHCHETKKLRGLLCRTCNAGIGLLKDQFEIVERAAQYLRKFEVISNV